MAHAVAFAGFDGATFTNAPNSGVVFVTSKPFEERVEGQAYASDHPATICAPRCRRCARPSSWSSRRPPCPASAPAAASSCYVQDRAGRGPPALERPRRHRRPRQPDARPRPGLHAVQHRTPQIYADIDRTKAEMLGVPISRVLRHAVDLYGLGLRQRLQHSGPHLPGDGAGRQPVPPDGARRREPAAPARVDRRHGAARRGRDLPRDHRPLSRAALQLYPAAEVQGATLPGFSTGQAIAAMERLAREACRPASASSGPRSRCRRSSPATPRSIAFSLAVVFVFLVLAAQYESWLLPLAVILIVPMCLLAAIIGVLLRGMDNNILTQIGLRRAGRPGRQERHPDRRVRQAGRGAGREPLGRGRGGRAHCGCGRS